MDTQIQQIKLQAIILYETKQSGWEAKASKARNEYAKLFSLLKIGDKVKLIEDGKRCSFGIIAGVKFNTKQRTFTYQIKPTNKDFSPSGKTFSYRWIDSDNKYTKLEKL